MSYLPVALNQQPNARYMIKYREDDDKFCRTLAPFNSVEECERELSERTRADEGEIINIKTREIVGRFTRRKATQ
jgi:hypothetical protein